MVQQPLFVTYWLGFANNGLRLEAIPAGIDVVHLFLLNLWPQTALDHGYIAGDGISWDEILAGARTLQDRGTKVVATLMSTAEPPCAWNLLEDPEGFAAQVHELVVNRWGLDGIDIDPEMTRNGVGAPPNERFIQVIGELERYFGPTSGTGKLMSYVSYELDLDRTLLERKHTAFDYVSLMGYFWPMTEMIAQFKDYAAIVGPEKLLYGVSAASPATPIGDVAALARWQPPGARKRGMMEFNINQDVDFKYASTIHDVLTS